MLALLAYNKHLVQTTYFSFKCPTYFVLFHFPQVDATYKRKRNNGRNFIGCAFVFSVVFLSSAEDIFATR